MNPEVAPKFCAVTGKQMPVQVAPQRELDKRPTLLDAAAVAAPLLDVRMPTAKACSLTDKAGAAVTPSLPALEPAFWDQRYAGKEFVWTADANQFLIDELEGMTPGTALDLASGEGRNALWLGSRGWFVRAVDFSAVATEKAQRLATDRRLDDWVAFETADLRAFEPPAATFDLVAVVYLQIPLHELAPILKRAVRAVAPRGTLLFIAHDIENLGKGFGGPQHPEMLYSVEQIVDALGHELLIEKAAQAKRHVNTAEGVKVAIDLVVRAKRA